jgi:hypothetical protein
MVFVRDQNKYGIKLLELNMQYKITISGEPHTSNDRYIKLHTLGNISLSGLRIIFNFSRESSCLK